MAQTMVNFRMDEDLKKAMEQTCQEMIEEMMEQAEKLLGRK